MRGISLLFGAAFLGAILYLTQFNQQVYGATASNAGLMLLPMVGGIMTSSIITGRLVSHFGRYKAFIMTGFSLATLSVLMLTTLQVDSPYWHEAIIMVFAGLGLGMAMPIINLAVQNEFPQKDLGAATSSVQVFRGLGSTVGTALLSGILTSGIISAIGNPQSIPYVRTLERSPAAAQFFEGEVSADTLLRINMQKQQITEGAQAALATAPLPQPVKDAQLAQLEREQSDFSGTVVAAFTDSLHRVFFISALLMFAGLVLLVFVREKPLPDNPAPTISE